MSSRETTALSFSKTGILFTSSAVSKTEGTITENLPVPEIISPAGIALLFCWMAL